MSPYVLLISIALAADPTPRAVALPPLERTFEAAPGLYCGSAPRDAAGYAALAKAGVRTVIRVDGAPPDARLAEAAGLQAVHLPVRFVDLDVSITPILQAVKALPGPHYVCCLYGSPRAPGVAALAMRALYGRTPDEAKAFLEQAGVAESYGGVHAGLARFQPPATIPSRATSEPFPAQSTVSPLVGAMTELVVGWDPLRKWKADGLKVDDEAELRRFRADVQRVAGAFGSSSSAPQASEHGAEFLALLREGATGAETLAGLLDEPPPLDDARRAAILEQIDLVGGTCSRCHRDYRN